MYKQPSLSSANAPASAPAPAPYRPYTGQHSDQRNLAAQIESALANDYNGSPYQAVKQRIPVSVSESKSDLPPPPPPKEKEIFRSEGDPPSQPEEVSPFADHKSEPPSSLRPGYVNVRQSTHTYGDGEGAYEGIN